MIIFSMSTEKEERINLPLSTEMYSAVKQRAAEEGSSAVGFIRRCITEELRKAPKINDLEHRLERLEKAFRAAEAQDRYNTRGQPTQNKKGAN